MKKEELLIIFHDTVTSISEILVKVRIKQNEIDKFMYDGKGYNEVRKQLKWIQERLQPAVNYYNQVWHFKSPESWKNLKIVSPQHFDFSVLEDRAKNLRKTWRERPRFK